MSYTSLPTVRGRLQIPTRQRGSKIPFSLNLSKCTIKLWNELYDNGILHCSDASRITREIGKIVGLEGCSISAISKVMTAPENWDKTKGYIALAVKK